MQLNLLTAISPIDGRYRSKVNELTPYFSEFGLIKYRVMIEIEYFLKLCELPIKDLKDVLPIAAEPLRSIVETFSLEDAQQIKEIEAVTNHDVKAVEYFVKEKFAQFDLAYVSEYVHFGLTSQDINNTAIPLSIMDAMNNVYFPMVEKIITKLIELTQKWEDVPMLAHTHGQPASPTRLGKEIQVYVDRLKEQLRLARYVPYCAKFGGATGNFNAHAVAFPSIDWVLFANEFINDLGLIRSQVTTQIEHYDNLAALFDSLKRINTILIDFDRDMWTYISMNYFIQKIKDTEVGSSAMPHKVNPIDFENSEGNLGIANAIYEHLSAKLPISRLQRDLSDSTVLRNIGVPFAHSILSFKSLLKGLEKLKLNQGKITADLEDNWMVIAEGIQTILRREGFPKPYEALKNLTRTNEKVSRESLHLFINGLDIKQEVKDELLQLSPFNYTGLKF